MKVILTGATGFIGGDVLLQALANPSITSLFVLTRRALPESATGNPKLKVIIHTDFLSYPPEVLSQVEDAESCIWAMGKPAHKAPDLETSRLVEVRYMLAAAEAFAKLRERHEFHFVLLGGMFTCRNPKGRLWFLHDARMIKGEAENGLLALQRKFPLLDVTIVRPGGVLPKDTSIPWFMMAPTLSIKVDELAAVMIHEAIADDSDSSTMECAALRARGRELLKGST